MKYCPPVDTITMIEARTNGWVSEYKEYQVIIQVDDIDVYKQYNKEFTAHFEFFQFSFDLAMSMVGPNGYKARLAYRDKLCPTGSKEEKSKVLKNITYHSMGFMKAIQNRKAFINNHPKKLEIARKIIQSRPFSKIITFSNNIKMAESIGIGPVYSGKDSKKKGRMTIDEFKAASAPAILNTIRKTDEGLDVPGLSVAIMIGIDSSKTKARQRLGRVARKEGDDKLAEVFNIVIDQTVELEWFRKSHEDSEIITIDENGLDAVLSGEEPKIYAKPVQKFQFRF